MANIDENNPFAQFVREEDSDETMRERAPEKVEAPTSVMFELDDDDTIAGAQTRKRFDDREADERSRVNSSLGLFGSNWGLLDEAGSKAWIEGEQKAAQDSIDFWSTTQSVLAARRDRLAKQRTVVGSRPSTIMPGAARNDGAYDGQDFFERKAASNLEHAQMRKAAADEMAAGKREGAKVQPWLAMSRSLAKGVTNDVMANVVKSMGIGASYAEEFVTGEPIEATTDSTLYSLGQWIESSAEETFPDDPARQYEFKIKLARGAGSMAGFYGPGVALQMATRMGAKGMMAVTAGLGSGAQSASMFDDATQAMSERPGEVSEGDRFNAWLAGIGTGATEAIPLGHILSGPGSGVVKSMLAEAFEEGGQEFAQSVLENLAASQFYDPNRNWDDNAWEGAAIGGLLGAKMSVAQSAWKKAKDTREARLRRGANGQPTATDATPSIEPPDGAAPQMPAPANDDDVEQSRGMAAYAPRGPSKRDGVLDQDIEDYLKSNNDLIVDEKGREFDAVRKPKEAREAVKRQLEALDRFADERDLKWYMDGGDVVLEDTDGNQYRPDSSNPNSMTFIETLGQDGPEALDADLAVQGFSGQAVTPEDKELFGDFNELLGEESVSANQAKNKSRFAEGANEASTDLNDVENASGIEVSPQGDSANSRQNANFDASKLAPKEFADYRALIRARQIASGEEGGLGLGSDPERVAVLDQKIAAFETKHASREVTNETRARFADILAGSTPRKGWASELGVTSAQMAELEAQAVKDGLLRKAANGQLRRAPKAKASAKVAAPVSQAPVVTNYPSLPVSHGAEHIVSTPDGSMRLRVRQEIVELSSLKAQTKKGKLQPRDRTTKASQEQVKKRAKDIDYTRLMPRETSSGGAPIVLANGTVLSGNGRVLAFKEAYKAKRPTAGVAKYREVLGARAAKMKQPVLIQRIIDAASMDDLARFAELSNLTADPGKVGSPEDLSAREAKAREFMKTPEWLGASLTGGIVTDRVPGYMTDVWKARRQYTDPVSSETIFGYDSAIERLTESRRAEVQGGALNQKRAFIVLGLPGAGKGTVSTVLRDRMRAVHITADDAKVMIPEYDGGFNAMGVHEESSVMASDVVDRLIVDGTNIILEKVGSSDSSIAKAARQFRDEGYEVNLVHVDVPRAVAMERAIGRYRKTGRIVPLAYYDQLNIGHIYNILKKEGATDETAKIEWVEPTGWRVVEASTDELRLDIPDAGSAARAGNAGVGGRSGAERAGSDVSAPQAAPGIPAAGSPESRVGRLVAEFEDRTGRLVDPQIVDYATRLTAALGDRTRFDSVFAEIVSDDTMTRDKAIVLADLVGAKPVTKKSTKRTSLDSIKARRVDIARFVEATGEGDAGIAGDVREAAGSLPEGSAPEAVSGMGQDGVFGGAPEGSGAGSGGAGGNAVVADADRTGPADGLYRAGEASGSDPLAGPGAGTAAGDIRASLTEDEIAEREARADRSRRNYEITDADAIGQGGAKAKVRGNIEALRVLKTIEEEGREATDEEKKVLVKYVGWGAFAQDLFAQHKPEWARERAQLADLLTPEEIKSARESTVNAHYTSPEVIRGMWGALQHLGYAGGRALEPAVGIGHFIGMTPKAVREDTSWTAVDLDTLSARITKALYGATDVRAAGYETQQWPDGFFDLVISNVPFGNFKPRDTRYPPMSIHDYYFVKSLDKTRPGGVVAFVTSAFTLDKTSSVARREIAKRGTFLGAIRLPGGNKGAFASNAGTEVTTDIIFLRRRIEGEPEGDTSWLSTEEIDTPEGKTKINSYFVQHPEMMLGKMRLQGTMYNDKTPVLIGPTDNLDARILAAAEAGLPANAIIERGQAVEEFGRDLDTEGVPGVKEGAFYDKGGKLYRRVEGVGQPVKGGKADLEKIRDFMGLRDIVNEMLASQAVGKTQRMDDLRASLDATYDAYVAKHGPVNKTTVSTSSRTDKAGNKIVTRRRPNFSPVQDDPDAYKVAAIEHYNEQTGEATKSAIFTSDIVGSYQRPDVTGPADALAVSLNEKGRVDIPFIAERLGMTEAQAIRELGARIYLDPVGDRWRTAEQYLSGDVVSKLDAAKAAAQSEAKYARNVKALEAVQPEPLTRVDIFVPMGATWVPADVYEDFIKETFGLYNVSISLSEATKKWVIEGKPYIPPSAEAQWGTSKVKAERILDAALNQTSITVSETGPDGKPVRDPAAEQDANARARALRDAFTGSPEAGVEGWIWQNEQRAQRLEALYNQGFNRLVPETHDGSHLTFPGLARVVSFPDGSTGTIDLLPHRTSAVWRIIQNGNTLLNHVVGAGKTWTMIMSGMEQKRLGLIQRPMYVVPNHMLEQFSTEFLQAYPNAKLLVASKDHMSLARRKEFAARVASEKWDGVIITHDAFGRLKMSDSAYADFYGEQIDQLMEMKERAAADRGKSSSVKEIEKAIKRITTKAKKLTNVERKDAGVTFEEMGIDFLYVDEAHLFKNLSFPTQHTRVKGIANASESQRATDLFIKIQALERSRPGRSAVFATGTPVSNTMAELYTMQRYLQLEALKEYGIAEFDAWAHTFGQIVGQTELAPDGRTFRSTEAFSRFVNIPELVAIYSRVADTKTADMLNLPRPKLEGGAINVVESEPSDAEAAYMEDLIARADRLRKSKVDPAEDNMLKIVSEGRKVATDMRLIDPAAAPNPDGKIAKAVENLYQIWEEGNAAGADAANRVQMVFLDMGVPGSKGAAKTKAAADESIEADIERIRRQLSEDGREDGEAEADLESAELTAGLFNLYEAIRNDLVARGIPKEEIAFIHEAKGDEGKARLFAATKAGKVRILIGSTSKMGVGTNVQKRLIAMHHIDAPWKPAEVEQRDGRIIRQGNMNKEVKMFRYVTRRSFDAYMWQTLERKARFIGQLQSGAKGIRTAEDIDNPLPEAATLKAAAAGDPRIMEHAELTKEINDLEVGRRAHLRAAAQARSQMAVSQQVIKSTTAILRNYEADAAKVTDTSGDNFTVNLTVTGKTVAVKERKKAGEAVRAYLLALGERAWYGGAQEHDIGEISGFAMSASVKRTDNGIEVVPKIAGASEYTPFSGFMLTPESDPVGIMGRYERLVRDVPSLVTASQIALDKASADIPRLEKQSQGSAYARQARLEEAKARHAEIERQLSGKEQPKTEATDGIKDFVKSVASLKKELGVATVPRKPSDDIIMPALLTAVIEQVDQIKTGSRITVLENSTAVFLSGATAIVENANKMRALRPDLASPAELETLADALNDFSQIVTDKVQEGYDLVETMDEVSLTLQARLEEISDYFFDINDEVGDMLSDISDKWREIEEMLPEINEDLETGDITDATNTEARELVPDQFWPEHYSALDILSEESSITEATMATVRADVARLLEVDIENMSEAELRALEGELSEAGEVLSRVRMAADWLTEMGITKRDEADGVIERIKEEKINPRLEELETAAEEIGEMIDGVDELLNGPYADDDGIIAPALAAYHGSGAIFNRFRNSAVGSGSTTHFTPGLHYFAYGHNFASAESVAAEYRRQQSVSLYDGAAYDMTNPAHVAARAIETEGSRAEAIANLENAAAYYERQAQDAGFSGWLSGERKYQNNLASTQRAAATAIQEGREAKVSSGGGVYEVRLDVETADLLSLNEPLSSQNEAVKALAAEVMVPGSPELAAVASSDDQEFANYINERIANGTADGFDLVSVLGGSSNPASSERLKAAGIPGVRYNDVFSVTAPGSTNYVIFDESDIEITAVDGKPVSSEARSAVIAEASDIIAPSLAAAPSDMLVVVDNIGPDQPHPNVPVLAFHGTLQGFDRFDMDRVRSGAFGMHFGTRGQANYISGVRGEGRQFEVPALERSRILPVVLDLKDVIDLPDLIMWAPGEMAYRIETSNPARFAGLQQLVADTRRNKSDFADRRAEETALRNRLTELGVDGIRYRNGVEGEGWSYIVWEKGHVTSAIDRDVTMMSLASRPSAGTSTWYRGDRQTDVGPASVLGPMFTDNVAVARTFGSPRMFTLRVTNPFKIQVDASQAPSPATLLAAAAGRARGTGYETSEEGFRLWRDELRAAGFDGILVEQPDGMAGPASVLVAFDADQAILSGRNDAYIDDLVREAIDGNARQDGTDLEGEGAGRAGEAASQGKRGARGNDGGGASLDRPGRRSLTPTLRAKSLTALLGPKYTPEAIEKRAKAQGFTLDAWHATASDFEVINPFRFNHDAGFHVAIDNPTAANSRVKTPTNIVERLSEWFGALTDAKAKKERSAVHALPLRVMPLKLRVKNPLRMPDIADWTWAQNWRDALVEMDDAPKGLANFVGDYMNTFGGLGDVLTSSHHFSQLMFAELERRGYDAVIYKNRFEGAAGVGRKAGTISLARGDSLFVWDASRVRSAYDTFNDEAANDSGVMASQPYVEAEVRESLNGLLKEEGLTDIDLYKLIADPELERNGTPLSGFERMAPEIREEIETEFRRVLPRGISFTLSDRLDADVLGFANAAKRAIVVSSQRGAGLAREVGRHETVHIFRNLGVWTEAEWDSLVARAKKLKIGRDITIGSADGTAMNALKTYRDYYVSEFNRIGYSEDVAKLELRELLDQELVAKMAESYVGRAVRYGATIDALFDRLLDVIAAIGRVLNKFGFRVLTDIVEMKDAEAAFEAAFSGGMADRQLQRRVPGERPALADELIRQMAKRRQGVPFTLGERGYIRPTQSPDMAALAAYHGSRHKFERFDDSFLLTGEGAMAFGPGFYFAEAEKTASSYRRAGGVPRGSYKVTLDGARIDNNDYADQLEAWRKAVRDPAYIARRNELTDAVEAAATAFAKVFAKETKRRRLDSSSMRMSRDLVRLSASNNAPISYSYGPRDQWEKDADLARGLIRDPSSWRYLDDLPKLKAAVNAVRDADQALWDHQKAAPLHPVKTHTSRFNNGWLDDQAEWMANFPNIGSWIASFGPLPSVREMMNEGDELALEMAKGIAEAKKLAKAGRLVWGEPINNGDVDPDGYLYTVELNVDESKLLDLDAAFINQPAFVRRALNSPRGRKLARHGLLSYILNPIGALRRKGKDVLENMTHASGDDDVNLLIELRALGLQGIKFLDGFSRRKGDGTHNYVIFDDKNIIVKTRNGEPVSGKEKAEAIQSAAGSDVMMAAFRSAPQTEDVEPTPEEIVEDAQEGSAIPNNEAIMASLVSEPLDAKIESGLRRLAAKLGAPKTSPQKSGSEPGAVSALMDIIEDLKSGLGMTATQGRYGLTVFDRTSGPDNNRPPRSWKFSPQEALRGQYDNRTGVARYKIASDIETIAHEGGHHVDRLLGPAMQSLKGQFRSELETFAFVNMTEAAPDRDVPNLPAPGQDPIRPAYSGVDLDADAQRILGEVATREELRQQQRAGSPNVVAELSAFDRASREELEHRVGTRRAEAFIRDVTRHSDAATRAAYIRGRFSANGVPRAGGKMSGALHEGFAEFFREYVLNPDRARSFSPAFYEAFEDLLDATDPALLMNLERAQMVATSKEYAAYLKATTLDRAMADLVSNADQTVAARAGRALANVGQRGTISAFASQVYANAVDEGHPLYLATKALLERIDIGQAQSANPNAVAPVSLAVHENPYKLMRSISDSFKTGLRWIQDGMPNYRETGGARSPSLWDALTKVMGTSWDLERYQKFGVYLESRRAIEEWKLWDKKLADIKKLTARINMAKSQASMLREALSKDRAKYDRRQRAMTANQALITDYDRELQSLTTREANEVRELQEGQIATPGMSAQRVRNAHSRLADIRARIAAFEDRRAEVNTRYVGLAQDVIEIGGRIEFLEAGIARREAILEQSRTERNRLREKGLKRPPHRIGAAEHAERIAALEAEMPDLNEAAEMVYAFLWQSAVHDHQAGRLTDDELAYRKERRKFYVPFARDMRDLVPDNRNLGGRSSSRRFAKDKHFEGSDRSVVNPLETIIDQTFHRAAATHFNDVIKALANLADVAGPNGGGEIAERIDRTEEIEANAQGFKTLEGDLIALGYDPDDAREMVKRVESDFGDTQLLLQWSPEHTGAVRPLMIPLWEKGERRFLRINDPDFANHVHNSINGMGRELSNLMLDWMSKPATLLRLGVTTNPTFIIPNVIRDMWSAWILTGSVMDPRTWPGIAQARGLYHEVRQTDMARLYQEVAGIMGGQNVASLSRVRDKMDVMALRDRGLHIKPMRLTIASSIGAAAGFTLGGPAGALAGSIIGAGLHRAGKSGLHFIETTAIFSDMSETATRLGTFTAAYKAALAYNPTLTPYQAAQEAAYVARDLIDFGRRGSKMLAASRLVPFLNANIQGLDKAARTLTARSDRGRVIGGAQLASVTAAGVVTGAALGGPLGAAVGATAAPAVATLLANRSDAVRRLLAPWHKRSLGLGLSADEQRILGDSAKAWVNLLCYSLILLAFRAVYWDDEEYKMIEPRVKNRAQPVKVWGEWFAIPKAFEWAIPSNLIEAGIDAHFNNDPRFLDRVKESLADNLTPPMIPQSAKLWRDIGANRNSLTNRPIVPEWQRALPPQEQFNAYSSEMAIGVSRYVNETPLLKSAVETAGSKIFATEFELSPLVLDYAISTGLGYWGKDIQKLSNIGRDSGPSSGRAVDFPILGTILQRISVDPFKANEAVSAFYEQMSPYAQGYPRSSAGYDAILRDRGQVEANQFLATLDDDHRAYALLMGSSNTTDRRLHPLNRLEDVVGAVRSVEQDVIMERLDNTEAPSDPERIALAPAKAAEVRDILAQIKGIEAHNTMVFMGFKQFAVREMKDAAPAYALLRAASPEAADELEVRMNRRKVQDFADVTTEWPTLKADLLEDWRLAVEAGNEAMPNPKKRRPTR